VYPKKPCHSLLDSYAVWIKIKIKIKKKDVVIFANDNYYDVESTSPKKAVGLGSNL
jgi:hypothetical protein